MTSHKCTCDDPNETICYPHKTFKISPWRLFYMNAHSFVMNYVCRFKWWMAKAVLGDLFYHTAFTCPACGNQYCPAKPEEMKK